MQPSLPHLSRTRVAVVVTAALALLPVLALVLLTGDRSAGALPAQRFTTRQRPSTVSTVSPTTEPDATPTTRSRPRTTEAPAPAPTRPATTARPATTRRSASPAATATTVATTFPTMPPSTAAPELLVAGPVNAETGTLEGDQGSSVSTSTALRWVIIGLVLVGLALAGLTVAYWVHTKPRRSQPWTSSDDGSSDPPSGTGPGFAPLARGGAEPYRPPGQVRPSGYPGDGGQAGAPSWGSPSGGSRSWEPAPPVSAGEGFERPWGSP